MDIVIIIILTIISIGMLVLSWNADRVVDWLFGPPDMTGVITKQNLLDAISDIKNTTGADLEEIKNCLLAVNERIKSIEEKRQ